jgi:hypothetical protein
VRQGWAQAVATNTFETTAIAGRHADVRMQGEALEAGASGTRRPQVKAGTRRLKSSRVEPLEGVVVDAPLGWIDAPEQEQGLAGDPPIDGLHLLVAGRRQGKERGRARHRRPGSEDAIGHEAVEVNVETKSA